MKTRIVRGIADSYVVKEAVDAVTGKPFLEVFEHIKVDDGEMQGEWLCDIDATMDDTDERILDEIDAAL
jgi:hypothetical protein